MFSAGLDLCRSLAELKAVVTCTMIITTARTTKHCIAYVYLTEVIMVNSLLEARETLRGKQRLQNLVEGTVVVPWTSMETAARPGIGHLVWPCCD